MEIKSGVISQGVDIHPMVHGTRGLLFTLFQLGTLGRLGVSTVVPGRQGETGI